MSKKYDGMDNGAFGDAHFAKHPETARAKLLGPNGIRLGHYRRPGYPRGWGDIIRYAGDAGLITIAPARTGKSRDLLVGALLEYEQSAFVIDPKAELACLTAARRRQMGQRVIILNPFGVWADRLGPSACYNPMDVLDPSSPDWDADCRKIAEGLIVGGHDRDSHWIGGARGLPTGIMGGLMAHGVEDTKNLAYVREVICSDELLLKYAQASQESEHAFIRQEFSSYTKAKPDNPAELAGFKQTAREQTSFLGMKTIAENLRHSDFRFSELKDKPTTVYVILPDNRLDVCGRWFRLIVASALDDLWRGGRGKYRVLAILDEFAQIGHLSVLENAAAAAAGRGVQLWPILQNIPQLEKDYPDVWETFLSAADIRMFFAPRDQTTAEYASKMAGQRTVATAGESFNDNGFFGRKSAGGQIGETGQPLIRPHEVSALGRNEALIFGPDGLVIDALRQPYFDTPELVGLADADPMHENDTAPPLPVNPDTIVTIADRLVASEERAARARKARRPFALRVLTCGNSTNNLAGIVRKLAYLVTLPIRLLLALLAAPFALHNRPLGAMIGFLALFGFWELWDGVVKQPVLTLYRMKAMEYQTEALARDPNSMGDVLNSNYRAAKWLIELPFRAMFGKTSSTPEPKAASGTTAGTSVSGTVNRLSGSLEDESRRAVKRTSDYDEAYDKRAVEKAFRDAENTGNAIHEAEVAKHRRDEDGAIDNAVADLSGQLNRQAKQQNDKIRDNTKEFVDAAINRGVAKADAGQRKVDEQFARENSPIKRKKYVNPIEFYEQHQEFFGGSPQANIPPIGPGDVQMLYDAGIAFGGCGKPEKPSCDDLLDRLRVAASHSR